MPRYLVQDIETIPETEVTDSWTGEFPPIWAHRVITIGMLALDENLRPVKGGCASGGCAGQATEAQMITRWSQTASGEFFGQSQPLQLVDWCGRTFDVPVLQTRAFRHGIPLPWYFGLLPDNRGGTSVWSKQYRDRYAGKHLDLADEWSNHGAFPRPRLAHLAQLMGLPGKCGFDGSMVHDAWKQGQFEQIDRYCMQDVIQTAFLLQRFFYLSGKLTKQAYLDAATALLDYTRATDPGLFSAIGKLELP